MNGFAKIVSILLCATVVLAGCATTAQQIEPPTREGTVKGYMQEWEEKQAQTGVKPPAWATTIFAKVLKELNYTQAELAKEKIHE